MDAFLQVFGSIPLSTVVLVIAALVFLYAVGKKVYSAISKYVVSKDEQKKTLEKISESIEDIKREQILLTESLVEMRTIQANFAEKQSVFEEGIKKRKLNELKDNLLKQYKAYGDKIKNPKQAWSEIERDSFFAMFKDYEDLGGNGFMHSTVEPAMNALQVIDMNDLQALEELAASRLKRANDII